MLSSIGPPPPPADDRGGTIPFFSAATTNSDEQYSIDNHNEEHHPLPSKFTRVDGKGLWRSWKRNFRNKLLALLDLIDNSLDASIVDSSGVGRGDGGVEDLSSDFVGRVHIYPDEIPNNDQPAVVASGNSAEREEWLAIAGQIFPDSVPSNNLNGGGATPLHPEEGANNNGGGATTASTGLCIVNNAMRSIRPLIQVLEVYNSSKIHSGAHDIGENGVGLKQGCATLSDLSFVMVTNKQQGYVELGIIAESLQSKEGCYLPAFRFDINYHGDTIQSLKDDMIKQFSNHVVAQCIEKYGSAVRGGSSASNLEQGIDRLCKHFDDILNFFNNRFVFAVVLDSIHYGNPNDTRTKEADPIVDLRAAIPRTYLHVPDSFDFRIGNARNGRGREKVVFQYWPQRLVEFSSFEVFVNQNLIWHVDAKQAAWNAMVQDQLDPSILDLDPEKSLASQMNGAGAHYLPLKDDPRFEKYFKMLPYKLRVFVGFDRMRINSSNEGKAASLYIYSRQSGRLIKYEPDGRFMLGMSAGGTQFCSGLTVLIDDIDGRLPLNPTKQDIAFGEEDNGEVHKTNLFKWVGSVSKFFYEYHLRKYDGKKTRLTAKIKEFGSDSVETALKTVDESELTNFTVNVKYYAKKSIRIDQASAEEVTGPDTHFHLVRDPAPPSPPPAASSPRETDMPTGNKRMRFDDAQGQYLTNQHSEQSVYPQQQYQQAYGHPYQHQQMQYLWSQHQQMQQQVRQQQLLQKYEDSTLGQGNQPPSQQSGRKSSSIAQNVLTEDQLKAMFSGGKSTEALVSQNANANGTTNEANGDDESLWTREDYKHKYEERTRYCTMLTERLEKSKDKNHRLKEGVKELREELEKSNNENHRLKEEVKELRNEVERQKQLRRKVADLMTEN